MAVTVTMPQLGETITEGTILSWAKQPGDTVEVDEVLLEISTDKVDTEVPSPAAGVVQEILVAEGETVTVGTPLAVIASADEAPVAEAPAVEAPAVEVPAVEVPAVEVPAVEVPAVEVPAVEVPAAEAAPAPAAPEPAATTPAATAAPLPEATPDSPRRTVLSPVVRRLAAEHGIDLNLVAGTGEGGRITRKDVMTLIDAGVARAGAGAVPPLAPAAPPAPGTAPTATVTFEPSGAPAPPPTAPPPAPSAAAAASAPPVVPASEVGAREEEIPRLRRVIAENMVNAKRTAAHVWTSVEVDYTPVEQVRQAHRAAWKQHEGFSLTYLPFIARATIDALAAYPVVNSAFNLEEGTQVFHQGVELGIAVDMNQTGLVVMTLRGAEGLRMTGLARGIRALAEKARAGKLELDDLQGSTFTITNPGPFGSFMSAPIINVPNVAILSTETVAKRPAVVTLPDGTDTIAIRHIGYLGLTWDHRVFDGSTAALFLGRIKQNLESWDWEQELT